MSARQEFSRATRRDALRRSGMLCEATGERYGLEPGKRCNAPLGRGVEFHHDMEAEFRGDNSLENCVCVCIPCHRFVTKVGIRAIRKSDRQRDKFTGAMKPSARPIPGSKRSGWRHRMDGTWERRNGE